MVTVSDSTDIKYFLCYSIGNLDSEMKPDLGFKKKKKIWPKLHARCFPLFWHCYTTTPFHTILLHTLPRIRMSSPIYPSFKDLFKACFFPEPFSLPEYYDIHTYKMLYGEFLSKVAGLTKRTLYSVSSLPLSFFFSLYWHVNVLFHIKMETLIFLGRLSILLLGKSCQYPPTKVTLTYILAVGHLGLLRVTEAFCGVGLPPSQPTRHPWQRSWLWLSSILQHWPQDRGFTNTFYWI